MARSSPPTTLPTCFEGWPLVASLGLALLAMSATILVLHGYSEAGVRMGIRATARTSVLLFVLAFCARPLRELWRSRASAWMLRNRRSLGVSFAVSHFLHLGLILALVESFPESESAQIDLLTILGGGLAYVFIAAMALTSFDGAQRAMGMRRWKLLHRVGSWYVWIIFAQSYVPRALLDPETLFYSGFAAFVMVVPTLRFAASWRRKRKSAVVTTSPAIAGGE